MNYSFFYSYTSDYQSQHTRVVDLINNPNCNTSNVTQYICNSIFPICDINSGEPIVVSEDDCLSIASQSSCGIFMQTPPTLSVNCSNSLQFIGENYQNLSSQPSSQCTTLQGNLNILIMLENGMLRQLCC